MIEKTVSLPRSGKTMEVFVVHPEGSGPFAPVVMYMDMWGMREVLRDLARRVATVGYCCVLPDFYYRGGKVRYAEADDARLGKSFADVSPERQALLQSAMGGLSDAMVLEDTVSLFEFLDGCDWVRPGPVGTIGYCMGGRHVLCVAGKFPGRVKASACLHGAYLVSDAEDSPHILATRAQGEIYFGHAERDKYASADVVERVNSALKGLAVRNTSRVHPGAQHGYAIPDRDVFDKHAANADWEQIFAMLRRQVPV
jgi:carboxymethylenebutenolidase